MEPCFVVHEIPLSEPWRERVLVMREPPRDRRGEPVESGICGLLGDVWTVAHGKYESFWIADGYVRRAWPHLHRPMSQTTFWVPIVEYRHL